MMIPNGYLWVVFNKYNTPIRNLVILSDSPHQSGLRLLEYLKKEFVGCFTLKDCLYRYPIYLEDCPADALREFINMSIGDDLLLVG